VWERIRLLARNFFLEGGAVIHFERRFNRRWVLVAVLLIVGFLGLRWAAISEAQAQDRDRQILELRQAEQAARARAEAAKQLAEQAQAEAAKKVEELRNAAVEAAKKADELGRAVAEAVRQTAPLPQRHFLEKGQTYTFTWQTRWVNATVDEEPRDNSVRVKVKMRDESTKGQEVIQTQWLNLHTVERIAKVTEAAGEKGSVKGVVTFNGKPVPKGTVAFHPEQGKVVAADINEDGQFTAEAIPTGVMRVTVTGGGVPEKYTDKQKTPLAVEIKKGQNQLHIELR
jgi:hypothetical protein